MLSTTLQTNFLTTDGSTRVSNSFTPTATGRLLVVPVIATGTVAAAATVTAAANGVSTFTLVSRATFGPTLHSVYIFVANQPTTGTSAMTVTFDCTADPHTGAGVMVAGVNGMSKVGSAAVKQFVKIDNGAGASTPSFVFSSSVLTYNATIYALGEISTGGVLTPASWTEGHSGVVFDADHRRRVRLPELRLRLDHGHLAGDGDGSRRRVRRVGHDYSVDGGRHRRRRFDGLR